MFVCSTLLAAAAASVSALTLAQTPGQIACASLTRAYPFKVSQPLTPDYLGSKNEYWNSRNSQYNPSCVFFPTTREEVSAAVKAIRSSKSRFAVKTAGHQTNLGFSSVDQGVLIDLGKMNQNTYDSATTIGTFQPGQNFGEIYKYFDQFKRTVVGARLAGVGTGLALGGGLSYLSNQYGLACDSFRELEIVLPSGEITTASPDKNADLFFGLRGGGGNAFGIVTKYTVQTHPSGTFYAGNLIFGLANRADVLVAVTNFVKYNTDPKAAIIATYEKIPLPSGINEVALLFLVYDGPDPGQAFANFTALPNPLVNTLKQMSYLDVVNLPAPGATELSKSDYSFRVAVHAVDDLSVYTRAFDAWSTWCDQNTDSFSLSSFDIQPISRSLTDASNAYAGGNAQQMPDGPYIWINYVLGLPPLLTVGQYDAIQASFKKMQESVPFTEGLPLFLNDANADQKPLRTFSSFGRLQEIKKKYDPDYYFANYTGGWTFD